MRPPCELNCTGESGPRQGEAASVTAPEQEEIGQQARYQCQAADDQQESLAMLREWNTPDIHSKQAGSQVDGKRQYCHKREDEQRPVYVLADFCRELFLQQLQPLREGC